MSKTTPDSNDIPVLSDVVSVGKNTDNNKAGSTNRPTPISSSHPLDETSNEPLPEVDLAKLEKLIAHKLQQRFKSLSKELAAEIIDELEAKQHKLK